jgi:hypothetical protein
MSWQIVHDPAHKRFETRVEGESCTLDYELDAATMAITHVNVPDAVARRGIAAALTEAALSHARASAWRVIAQCPYAEWYVREHPEWANVLAR